MNVTDFLKWTHIFKTEEENWHYQILPKQEECRIIINKNK